MRIECPNCGAKGEIDESKRPQGAVSIRCPRCKGSIPLDGVMKDSSTAAAGKGDAGPNAPATSDTPRESTAPVSDTEPVVRNICSICNKQFPREDLVRFGPSLVCASCKPMYVQMLEQGAARPGSLRYAGFWIRFCAKIVDGLILMVINFTISFLLNLMIVSAGNPSSVVMANVFSSLLNLAIAVSMTTYFLGRFAATPGKMALGLLVVSPEGERISYLRAFGRYFAEILSSIILCIGYLMVAFDDEKRGLHDRLCDTRVVYK